MTFYYSAIGNNLNKDFDEFDELLFKEKQINVNRGNGLKLLYRAFLITGAGIETGSY